MAAPGRSHTVMALVGIAGVAVGLAVAMGWFDGDGDTRVSSAMDPANSVSRSTAEPLDITATPVDLLPTNPGLRTLGALTFVKGWVLQSDHPRFGGWSGLVLSGRTLTAISDQGWWLEARFDIAGEAPLTDASIRPFSPETRTASKSDLDAESLIAAPLGFLVAFEQNHRLSYASVPGGWTWDIALDRLPDLSGLPRNGGLEAIAWTADDALLMFSERGLDPQGRLKAWRWNALGKGTERTEVFYLKPGSNFAPTDAVRLPSGDILVLQRRYTPADGVAARLVRLRAASVAAGLAGRTLQGDLLAEWAPPYTVDNMEALAVIDRDNGSPRLIMMSDDNFSRTQRTLLMVFDLAGA